MIRPRSHLLMSTCFAALGMTSVNAMSADSTRVWRFNVSLDGKPIGYHRFELSEHGQDRELHSEARFDVKVLFINAYRYRHDSLERWQGDCLARIDARTDDNGSRTIVHGAMTAAGFEIASAGGERELPSCVQTFA